MHRPERRSPILAAAAALATACASPPPPAPQPLAAPAGLEVTGYWRAGQALEAGAPRSLAKEPPRAGDASAWVRVELALLARRPEEGATRFVDALGVVADPHVAGSVRLPSRAAERTHVWRGEAAHELWETLQGAGDIEFLQLGAGDEPLHEGFTTWVAASCKETFEDPDDFLRERRGAQPLQRRFALALEGGREASVTLERGSAGVDGELCKLAQPLRAGDGPLLIVAPSPFAGGHGGWCAAYAEVRPLDALDDERWAARVAQLQEAERARIVAATPSALRASERLGAFQLLPGDASGRLALVWLTAGTPRTAIADLALVAADAELAQLLERIAKRRTAGPPPADEKALDLLLEGEALLFLADRIIAGALPAELASVASRRAGGLDEYPSTLADVVRRAGDCDDLVQRLVAENRLLLEESNAAVRVRAFDWLARRSLAPAGFDPLAGEEARREALAAQLAREAEAANAEDEESEGG